VSRIATARSALRLAWQAASLLVLGRLVGAVIQGVAPVAAAWCAKQILDRLSQPGVTAAAIALPVLVLAAASLLTGLLAPVDTYLAHELDRRVGIRARTRLLDAVARLQGLRRFEDPAFLSRLRLAEGSASSAPGRVVSGVLGIGRGAMVTAGFVLSLLTLSPVMTAVVVLAAVPAMFAQLAISRRRASMMWSTSPLERREIFYSGLLTQVQAAKEIRLFGLAGLFGDRMLAERGAADRQRRQVDRRELTTQGGLAVLAAAVSGVGLVWAGFAAASGRLTVGDISMFIAALAGLQSAVAGSVSSIADLHQDVLLFDHLLAVERTPPDIVAPAAPRPLSALRQGIELRDVWFRYDDDQPWVLRGVNLTITAGSALGVVGHNGAGKSTLVKLLCRLYEPTRGAILWDGVDVREVPVADLRVRIGAVFQDFMCYELTAEENIGVGDLDAIADRHRIEHAAGKAGVDETVRGLAKGYQTLLSRNFYDEADGDTEEAGTFLSGGQWQKLATARAMLRDDRDLMILDEPSSGLDADAEYDLHHRLRELRRGRTSVLISHRLGALRDADLIVTLDGGRIVETGDHQTLLSRNGVYAGLFRKQASGYHLEQVSR
jgi:ATP-binding cassette, subfamily B, bacterial